MDNIRPPLPDHGELFALLMANVREYTLILLDADGRIVGWNAGAEQMLGYHAADIVGSHFSRLFTIEDQATERPRRELETALLQGRAADDNWLVRKDRSRFWAAGLTMPLWDAQHRLRCFVKIVRDATERKQVEAALLESEARFRATFEQAAVGLAHVSLDGHWIRVNQKLCEIVGYSRDELVQRTFQAITHPDDLAADLASFDQVLVGTIATYTMEKRYIHKDGAFVWVNLTVALVRDTSGQPSYCISVIEDITPRKQAETALQQAHQRTSEILESIHDAFYALDTDWRFTYINGRTEQLWNRNREDVLGKRIWDVFPQAVGTQPYHAHLQARHEGRPVNFETVSPIIHTWIDVTIYPSAAGMSVYFRDIRARKQAEAERAELLAGEQAARQQAEEAVRTRDAFLSVVSHELKSPLTSLVGYAQLLERRAQGLLPEREQALLQKVVEQAQRLNRMLGHLLDLSLLESGQIRMERELVDLASLAQQIVEEMQPIFGDRQVTLHDKAQPPLVLGDAVRLEQVLRNVLQNAVKYSPAGSPISILITQRDTQVCIAVADQGIGIPEAAQAHLFERYYRAAHTGGQRVSGAGIGLYVAKEIMALHGGTIDVQSTEGQGSTFTICLPVLEARS